MAHAAGLKVAWAMSSHNNSLSAVAVPDPSRAIVMMLSATAFIAATTLMAKALGRGFDGQPLPPFMVSAGRFVFAWLILCPLVLWRRPSFAGTAWPLHGARSLCGWAGVSCLFAAAAVLPLSDATAISFLNPMIAMLLAIPLLGEHIGPWRWGSAAVAMIGASVLIRPGGASFEPYALIALAAAGFMAMEVIFIKKLAGGATFAGEPPLRILFVNNSIGMCIALTAASFVWIWPSPGQWLLLALLGATMVSAQAFFLQALKWADASFVMPFNYATLVFATLYDALVFGDLPTALSIMGAALIIASAIVLAWRERVNPVTSPPSSPRR
ncbi:MAG: DMT family transporter [Hyphomicrobiaceae bacterium]|nr:DMT family transporter [Hyphomicrobiaceae bacterium]